MQQSVGGLQFGIPLRAPKLFDADVGYNTSLNTHPPPPTPPQKKRYIHIYIYVYIRFYHTSITKPPLRDLYYIHPHTTLNLVS